MFKKAEDVRFQPQKFAALKSFLAVIAVLLFFGQIFAAVRICGYLNQSYREISIGDFESLKTGELVKGTINKSDVILSYREEYENGGAAECLLVMTPNHKLMVVAANQSVEGAYEQMMRMVNGDISYFDYKGTVISLPSLSYQSAQIKMATNNIFYPYELDNKAFIGQTISAVDVDTAYAVSALIATFAGMAAMVVAFYFLMRKTINNARYTILVEKGIIEPELKVRREDLVLENTETYKGGDNDAESFYVNTDYDVHLNGGNGGNSDNSGEGYHFSQAAATPSPAAEEEKQEKPVQPMRFHDDNGFYQSGVNDEGNFYIPSGDELPPQDESTRHYKKY